MTYKRPLRLTILHLEQRLRMDAETFMILFSLISCQAGLAKPKFTLYTRYGFSSRKRHREQQFQI